MTPRSPLVLAIDVGSSSARAVLYDRHGVPRRGASAHVAYERDVDGRGAVTVPVERLLDVVGRTIDGLVTRAGPDLGRVAAVGTSCFLHSMAALDGDDRPVSPLLTWADTTARDEADGLRARLDSAGIWRATGAPLHASYWPAKIVRARTAGQGAAAGFRGAPELLWRWLTARDGIDLSHASGTGLVDRASGDWHPDLLAALAVSAQQLPPILPAFAAATLSGAAARRWPQLAGVPWYAPWSDASCGNIGLGCVGPLAALQVGTSSAIRVVVDGPVAAAPAGLFVQLLPDRRSLVGGQLSEGGGTAAAIARLLGVSMAAAERAAGALAPAGHGLTVLPFLAGERGPGYHERARGAVDGLSLATTPADVYLATLEAIALRLATIDRRIAEVLGHPGEVIGSGGALVRSPLLAGTIAAALGRPIGLSREREASARGAALYALTASGLIENPEEVPAPTSVPVVPDPVSVRAYRDAGARQDDLYRRLVGDA